MKDEAEYPNAQLQLISKCYYTMEALTTVLIATTNKRSK